MASQISIRDEANQFAFFCDSDSAKALAAHDVDDIAHGSIRIGQGQGISHMHDLLDLPEFFPQFPAGVESPEIFRAKAVRLQERQSQSIPQGKLHGGGCRGGATDRAGFLHIRKL